ncbi:MAG: hypothetical protein ACYTHM_16825 [Planctomycetota bacterium]
MKLHSFLLIFAVLGLVAGCGSGGKQGGKTKETVPSASKSEAEKGGRQEKAEEAEVSKRDTEEVPAPKAPEVKPLEVHVTAPKISGEGVTICQFEVDELPLGVKELKSWLKRETREYRDDKNPRLSTRPLHIRTHKDTPYRWIQFLLIECVQPGVGIWKYRVFEGARDLPIYLPTDVSPVSSEAKEQNLPIRLVLRWNPTIKRCKVYVGQVLCNYDGKGIARAKKLIAQITQRGVNTAEIDGGGDVPMFWILEALDMLIQSRLEKIHFSAQMEPNKKTD